MTAATTNAGAALVLLPNHAMRARRRPAAVLALWGWEALVALGLGWPVASTVAAYYGEHPDGDAPLWAPGAFPLMSLGLRVGRAAGPTLMVHAAVVLVLAVALGVWSTGAMLASLAYTTRDLRAPTLRQALEAGLAAFAPSALVFVPLALVQLLLVASGWSLGHYASESLYFKLGEAHADQIGGALAVAFFGVACVVGVVEEVARAAVVRFRASAGRAVVVGLKALRRAPLTLTWSWAWRVLAGIVPIAFGSLVAERLGGRGGVALLALAFVHQAVAMSRVALRASWLARAMRAVDAAPRRSVR